MENYQAGFPWSYANWQSHVQAAKEAAEERMCTAGGTDIPCRRCFHDLAAHPCICLRDCQKAPCRHKPVCAWDEDYAFPCPIFDVERKVQPRVLHSRYENYRRTDEDDE